jgi:hypothetical protein
LIARLVGAVIAAAALSIATPTPAHAQAATVMPSSVPSDAQLGIVVIRASQGDVPRLDPRLSGWSHHLASLPFQVFDLVAEHKWRVHDGGRQELALPEGRSTTLTLSSHGPTEAKVSLSSRHAGHEPIETVLTVKRDRAFFYVLRTGKDSALLLRVDVHY